MNRTERDSETLTEGQIISRLERLPMTRALWLLVLIAGGAWFVESLSIGAIGVVLPILKPLWHLTPGQVGLLAVASTIGVVVGLIPAGRLSDRFGRVRVLTWGIVAYSTLTVLGAFSLQYQDLLVLRFLAGLGMGAVFPLPYAIVGELVRKNQRTWLSGFLDATLSVGYFIAPLLGLLIMPHLAPTLSWRLFMITAGLPFLYAILVHRLLPESPRWLLQHGRAREAAAVLDDLERRTARYYQGELPAITTLEEIPPSMPPSSAPSASIWRSLIGRTVISAVGATGTFFMFYVVMTYTPTIFAAQGMSFATSLGFAALVTASAIPGKLLNGHLSESWGRKPMFAVFMGLAAIAAFLFGTIHQPGLMLLDAMAMSFFGTGAFPGLKMYYAEQYPTHARVTGSATVEAVSRTLGGIVGAALMPLAWHTLGVAVAFEIIGAVALVSVIVLAIWGQETRGMTLEAIQQRYQVKSARARHA